MSKRFWLVLSAVILIVFGWLWVQHRPDVPGVFPEVVKDIWYSPKGTYILVRSDDNLFVWHLNTEHTQRIYRGSKLHLCDVALCPNDRYLAISCGNLISIVEVSNGHINQEIRLPEADAHFYVVSSMVFSPDGQMLAVSAHAIPFHRAQDENLADRLWLYDLTTGKQQSVGRWIARYRTHRASMTPIWLRVVSWQKEELNVLAGIQSNSYWCRVDPVSDRLIEQPYQIDDFLMLQQLLPNNGLIQDSSYQDEHSKQFITQLTYLDLVSGKKKIVFTEPFFLMKGFEEPVGIYAAHANKVVVFGFRGSDSEVLEAVVWLIDPIKNERRLLLQGSVSAEASGFIMRVALSPDARWLAYRSLSNPYRVILKKVE